MTKELITITELLDILTLLGFKYKEENIELAGDRSRTMTARNNFHRHEMEFTYRAGDYSQLDSMRHNKQFLDYVLTQIRKQLES